MAALAKAVLKSSQHSRFKIVFVFLSRSQELFGFGRLAASRHFHQFQDVIDSRSQAFQAARHFVQTFIAEVQGAAIVVGNEEEAQGVRAVMSQDVFDQEEVVQGLTHLFGVDRNEPLCSQYLTIGFLPVKASDWAISFS